MTFEEEFTSLSSKCRQFIRIGQISMYSSTLKEMADLFHRNHRVRDQLKALITAFYIDLSGFSRAPFIDRAFSANLRNALECASIDKEELERLFFEWIQPDMIAQHALSLKNCWYLLQLCAEGKTEQADYILTKI